MAVSERDRHELYEELQRKLGKGPTETMMALLPPAGWAEVATKHDLAELEGRVSTRIAALDTKIEGVEAKLAGKIEASEARTNARILKTALVVNIPSILSAVALSFTAARLGA